MSFLDVFNLFQGILQIKNCKDLIRRVFYNNNDDYNDGDDNTVDVIVY